MATDVSICSNALLRLGARPINSFDDAALPGGVDRAMIARNLWPTVRDSVLRSHPWNCAIKRVVLSPEVAPPPFGFSHQFLLPGDWLRNHEINGVRVDQVDFVVEGRRILIDEATIHLRYIWKNTDVTTWDGLLVAAAELAMAVAMAYPITQSDTREAQLYKILESTMQQARTVDGQDDSPQTFGSFEILNARRFMP